MNQTDAQISAQLGAVSRALGLPLHFHTGADGFADGALRVVRQDGARHLYRMVGDAGAGENLTGAMRPAELRAFLSGMLAAARIADADADRRALDAVAELLSAADWSSDHLDAVADMVRATGRTIADL